MLVRITGTRNGQDWPDAGEVIEVPAHEAAALIRQFNAIPAPPEPEPETAEVEEAAVVEPITEEAAIRRTRTRRA